MDKHELLLLAVFIFTMVGFAHYFSLKMLSLSAAKKNKYRRRFWYFYGVVYMVIGLGHLFSTEGVSFNFLFWFLFGVVILILNFLGKLNEKTD